MTILHTVTLTIETPDDWTAQDIDKELRIEMGFVSRLDHFVRYGRPVPVTITIGPVLPEPQAPTP